MTTTSDGISVRGKSAKGSTPAALQIRNVLVAIDFSAPSLEAIEAALPLIKHFGADLHVVHGSDSKKQPAQRPATFRKILVPVDLSDCSMKGLGYAKALANEFKAKLILLHSIALQYYVASDEYARYDFPLLMQQADRTAKQQMRDLVQQTNWNGIETSIQIGHAGQQICTEASDRKADLIAISTHGKTWFKHVLLGSTAEYVVRHTACPVLVVPSRDRALPKPAVASK